MAVHIGKPENVKQIMPENDPGLLEKNLNLLCQKAKEAGAADAAVIKSSNVVFNPEITERVKLNDPYPSVHWPLEYPKDDIKEAIQLYSFGIFFRLAPVPGMPDYGGGPITDKSHRSIYIRLYDIVTLIESTCFYKGYYLAVGFATGNCRSVFCSDEKRCRPMLKGKTCVHPNKGRPSMASAAIDARAMAENLNWTFPEKGTPPLLAGLVMVA